MIKGSYYKRIGLMRKKLKETAAAARKQDELLSMNALCIAFKDQFMIGRKPIEEAIQEYSMEDVISNE